jgi:hypothetical protein
MVSAMWRSDWTVWAIKSAPWAAALTAHLIALPVIVFWTDLPGGRKEEKITLIALEALSFAEDEPEPVAPVPEPEPRPEPERVALSENTPAPESVAQTQSDGPAPLTSSAPPPDLSISAPRPDILTSKGDIPPPPVYTPPSVSPTQKTLQALSCNRLGKNDLRAECQTSSDGALPEQFAITAPEGWQTIEIGPNPFETAVDKLARKQYAGRSTPYSLRQTNSSDHQHANPFAGVQSSAERDLTGRVNASPDPVWGD